MLGNSRPTAADVYATRELFRRAPKKIDYLAEKQALQELADRMAERPEDVLPRFVSLAMEMTGGVSAGLSLYEERPAPGVFRWKYLRGMLSPFENATTPRDFSPCGVTLDHNAPVLSQHPERFYSWISDANIVVPEVLLLPLYIGRKEPLGTLWIVADKVGHFDRGDARAMTELATFVGIALKIIRTEEQLQRAVVEQHTLAREMNHRVQNVFAMTHGMVRATARKATSANEMEALLSGRLHALAKAHALVRRDLVNELSGSESADLASLIRAIVLPHDMDGAERKITIEGPPLRSSSRSSTRLALVLHELTTNAVKYGALSRPGGKVAINWRSQDAKLILSWQEHGGPPIIAPPQTKGFGSALVHSTIVSQGAGEVEYEWRSHGLAVTISMPLSALND